MAAASTGAGAIAAATAADSGASAIGRRTDGAGLARAIARRSLAAFESAGASHGGLLMPGDAGAERNVVSRGFLEFLDSPAGRQSPSNSAVDR